MSDIVEQARRLVDAATPGPWFRGDESPNYFFGKGDVFCRDDIMYRSGAFCLLNTNPNFPVEGADNAAFIAAARELVPALCDEVDRLTRELAEANARPIEDALRTELEAEREKTRALSEALSDANRWIPVGERLPESHEARCFYCDPYEIGLCSFSRGLFWPDDANGCFDTMVTHWRPLPEPPEGTR